MPALPQKRIGISRTHPSAMQEGDLTFAFTAGNPERLFHRFSGITHEYWAGKPLFDPEFRDEAQNTYAHRDIYNGTFRETFDALVTESGGTVTCTVTNSISGNLTMQYSDGDATLLTPATIVLTAGSDSSPTDNFIYIPQSTKVLTKSTSDWPAGEHIRVAYFFVPSAAFVSSNGVYVNQNWNDHDVGTDNQGHLAHITDRQRRMSAQYFSGVAGNGSQGYLTPTAGNVELKATAGIVYQVHKHTVAAFDTSGTDQVLVKNWAGVEGTFHDITNLYDITTDSGNNIIGNNKFFNLVIWGVVNKSGEYTPMIINLPSGFYNTQSGAESDLEGFDDFAIPPAFGKESSTGFLIARITIQMKTGGGTWVVKATVDLRGFNPQSASGGAASNEVEFADNVFEVFNVSDPTKELAFDVGTLVTTGNKRTLKVPDASGIMALTGQSDGTIDVSDITAASFDDILVGTGLDVSGGADTVANGDVTISLDLTEVITGDAANRVLTSDGDGTLTAELGMVFTGGVLTLTDTEADDTTKSTKIISRQYDSGTETEGFAGIGLFSPDANTNHIFIGGGSGAVNAATEISFYAAANATTRTGTEIMTVISTGVGIGTAGPGEKLDVFDGDITLSSSNQAIVNATDLGSYKWYVDDDSSGEGLELAAQIQYEASGTWSESAAPASMNFMLKTSADFTPSVKMTITNFGRVGINKEAPLAQLHIDQSSTSAAQPVLALDQADTSEGFINFIGSDRGVITGATNSLKSVRVELSGTVYRLALFVDA